MSAVAVARTPDGLRNVFGRGMNIHSDVYKLPADAEEHDRLTIQHRIWKLVIGGSGLYPPEVEGDIARLLAPAGSGNEPLVLDLGTGSGIWAAEMAAMYPHVKVIGLDLAEPKLHTFPKNCSFATTDASKGLNEYAESFDVVHCRCVAGHVIDRPELVRTLASVLKPGGLLLLADGNSHVYASDGARIPPADADSGVGSSWMGRWLAEVIGRMIAGTRDPERAGGDMLAPLVRAEPALAYAGARAYYSPVHAGGAPDEREQEVARLTERNMLYFLTSSKPVLLSNGLADATVDEWQRRARAEILELPVRWSMRWDITWATKNIA